MEGTAAARNPAQRHQEMHPNTTNRPEPGRTADHDGAAWRMEQLSKIGTRSESYAARWRLDLAQ